MSEGKYNTCTNDRKGATSNPTVVVVVVVAADVVK